MKKENLYRAIGNMDSKIIAEVIRDDTGSSCEMHDEAHFLSDERTIEMNVVRKTEKNIIIRIAAAFTAAAVAAGAAAAFGFGTGKDKKEYKEKKIENYFSEDRTFRLSPEILEMSAVIPSEDGFLMEAYVSGMDAENYISVYDSENDIFTDLDMSETEGNVYKMYSGRKHLWAAASDDDKASGTLVCYNAETLTAESKKELEYGEYVADITEYEDGSCVFDVFRCDSENNITEWSFCYADSSMNETDRKTVYSGNASEGKSLTSCIRSPENGEYCLFFTSWEDMSVTMYRYSADGTELYHRENIAADMDGYQRGIYFTRSGNPAFMTQYITGSGDEQRYVYQINEFDSESGDVINRSNSEFSDYIPWMVNKDWNYSDDYDFVWVWDSEVYGFSSDCNDAELILDLTGFGQRYKNAVLVSSGSGPLMISGKEPAGQETGYYTVQTDGSGSIKAKRRMPSCDIEVMKHGTDGQIYAVVSEHESSDTKDRLTDTFKLCTVDGSCSFKDAVTLEVDNSYCPTIKDMAVTDKNAVLLITTGMDGHPCDKLLCFNRNGKLTVSYDMRDADISCLFVKNGNIYAVCSSPEGTYIKCVNTEKQELREAVKPDFSTYYGTAFSEGNDGYDFFVTYDDGIYGYSMESNTLTGFLNWMDSDIYFSQLEKLCITDNNRIILGSMDNDENNRVVYNVKSFVRADDETLGKIQSRKLITAAFISSPDESLVRFFRDYNKSSSEYRVHIDDYSKYGESDNIFAVSSHLDSEIIKGNIPDIIFAGSRFDWLRYTSDGMLASVSDFMNNDPEFDRSLYFENILDAFSMYGKQYAVPLGFRLSTLAAKKSVTGGREGYSISEICELAESRDLFAGEVHWHLLESFVLSDISEYADMKKGECSFDTPEFVKLLNLIKEQGTPDSNDMDYFSVMETGVPEDRYMFILSDLNDFSSASVEQQVFIGGETSYTGIPSASDGRPLAVSEVTAGITVRSKVKNESWNIIKQLLSDEVQRSLANTGFPVNISAFDIDAQEAVQSREQPLIWTTRSGKEIRLRKPDKSTAEQIRSAVERTEKAAMYDSGAAGIIDEEFCAFIDGTQTAEETAGNIQRKVTLYLKEIK